MMITIILVEPESSGNIGSVARVMENFDFKKLVLINPKCNHLDEQGIMFAKSAIKTLKSAKVCKIDVLDEFDLLVATTSRLGSDYNITRSPINPDQLVTALKEVKGNIGIVFGRESSGLKTEEIRKCDFSLTIPTSKKYAAMNLAQSVNIILYELFKAKGRGKVGSNIKLATKKERELLLGKIYQKLDKMQFSTEEKRQTQKLLWKKILGKSYLTKRELFALHGFFGKI